MNLLEIIAVALGIANVGLLVRRSIWNYPFGMAMVALYLVIFWEARLYGEAVLQVFQDLHHHPPPPATLLAIRASAFELGSAPGADALADLDQALAWAGRWLQGAHTAEEVPA